MRVTVYEDWGRVIRHDNGGFTLVQITDEAGNPLNHAGDLEIPTASIPQQLRPIGSRFRFQWDAIWPELSDTADELRARCRAAVRVLEHGADR